MNMQGDFQNKKICVAVSGGGDSVALLHYMKNHQAEGGYLLSAVHCEHGIRGQESLDDQAFVQALCREWEIPLHLFSADCMARSKSGKSSLETAARAFRYECFSKLLEGGECDFIATAHHQKDEAETVLFRIARGTALGGAAAMREQCGGYIRPFLHTSKGEILEYIERHGLTFREDYTNFQTQATRNKIRLEVLPKLEEAVPEATKNIASFAALAAEDDALLYRLSEGLLCYGQGEVTVRFSQEKPLFTRACLTALKGLGLTRDYTSTHLRDLFALQDLERGAQLTLPQNVRAKKGEEGVVFFLNEERSLPPLGEEKAFTESGFAGGMYEVKLSETPPKEGEFVEKLLRLDIDKLPESAVFRFRQEGDSMATFGSGRKTLKKLFNEKKIPPTLRGYLPLIAEEEGEVYAVCGVEISENVKVDEGTKKVRYLYLQRQEG